MEYESDITCHLPSRRYIEWRYGDNGGRWWMVALHGIQQNFSVTFGCEGCRVQSVQSVQAAQ